jgi:hypothetical protein
MDTAKAAVGGIDSKQFVPSYEVSPEIKMAVQLEDLVFDAARWPQAPVDGSFRAMTVLPGTGSKFEVIRIFGETAQISQYRPLKEQFSEALKALKALDDHQRLGVGYSIGKPKVVTAVAALQRLIDALRADREDELDGSLTPLESYLNDPLLLSADLALAIETFVERKLLAETSRLCTFSLILFREDDLAGELVRSLTTQRSQWRKALTPNEMTQPDTHLAIVPPPTAKVAIEALASAYGCQGMLPCVVFVGDMPKLKSQPTLVTRLSVRKLHSPPPAIPEQLQTIYHSVYSRWAPWRGTPAAAAVDKFGPAIYRRIDTKVAVGLLAGAVGGSGMVDAIDLIFRLIRK